MNSHTLHVHLHLCVHLQVADLAFAALCMVCAAALSFLLLHTSWAASLLKVPHSALFSLLFFLTL